MAAGCNEQNIMSTSKYCKASDHLLLLTWVLISQSAWYIMSTFIHIMLSPQCEVPKDFENHFIYHIPSVQVCQTSE